MVATHNFQELIFSARLCYCVSVFDSSVEPATHPGISDSCAPGGSGTEFEVGRTTSFEVGTHAAMNAPMDHESSIG